MTGRRKDEKVTECWGLCPFSSQPLNSQSFLEHILPQHFVEHVCNICHSKTYRCLFHTSSNCGSYSFVNSVFFITCRHSKLIHGACVPRCIFNPCFQGHSVVMPGSRQNKSSHVCKATYTSALQNGSRKTIPSKTGGESVEMKEGLWKASLPLSSWLGPQKRNDGHPPPPQPGQGLCTWAWIAEEISIYKAPLYRRKYGLIFTMTG